MRLRSKALAAGGALLAIHLLRRQRERWDLSGRTVLVNLSGRGDKDVAQMMAILS